MGKARGRLAQIAVWRKANLFVLKHKTGASVLKNCNAIFVRPSPSKPVQLQEVVKDRAMMARVSERVDRRDVDRNCGAAVARPVRRRSAAESTGRRRRLFDSPDRALGHVPERKTLTLTLTIEPAHDLVVLDGLALPRPGRFSGRCAASLGGHIFNFLIRKCRKKNLVKSLAISSIIEGMDNGHKLTLLELYRRARGWSQTDLAKSLGNGFTASAISLLEGQRLRPSPRQERRLREVFGDAAEAVLKPIDPVGVPLPEADPS